MATAPGRKRAASSAILTPKERRERDRKQMRDTILDVARDIMKEEGVNGLTLHKLAAAVKVQPPSIYEYFDGKNGIYDALYLRGVEDLQKMLLPKLKPDVSFFVLCATIIDSVSRFAKQSPDLYALVFENPVAGFSPGEEAKAKAGQGLREGLKVLSSRLAEENRALPISAEDALLLVEIIAHGVASRSLAERLLEAEGGDIGKRATKALVTLFGAKGA
jgi:AcrR family transcriptional regulator